MFEGRSEAGGDNVVPNMNPPARMRAQHSATKTGPAAPVRVSAHLDGNQAEPKDVMRVSESRQYVRVRMESEMRESKDALGEMA